MIWSYNAKRILLYLPVILLFFFFAGFYENVNASTLKEAGRFIKEKDAILITDSKGNIIFSKNADQKLVPASTLKIFTSLVSLYYLGEDYRFTTKFYLDKHLNLRIKGYGDPMLTSEEVARLSRTLSDNLPRFNDIIADGSYFAQSLAIPGVGSSLNPYDASNCALSVNFNTVAFRKDKNTYVSDESQTPLLPFVTDSVRKSGLTRGRIRLSNYNNQCTLYAGHLFRYFLQKNMVKTDGIVRTGRAGPGNRLIYKYNSSFSLTHILSDMLKYSNNFIANQLILATGAKVYGAPATLKKGVRAALAYSRDVLNINDFNFVEGSGISRKNLISAKTMMIILKKFEPYYQLMKKSDNIFFKTGTLNGIKTRAGYIKSDMRGMYRFVVFINTLETPIQSVMEHVVELTY